MKSMLCALLLVTCFTQSAWAHDDGADIKVAVLAKSTQSWDGQPLPNYAAGKPEVTILKITIPAGAKLPLHLHPYINAGILMKGELTVVTEKQEILHLKAGDSLVEVVNKWHYGSNQGLEPAEIIVFYAGIEGQPITVKK